MRGKLPMHMHARKQRKRNASTHYLFLFICSGSLDLGTILPMFRVGLPTSVKPLWKNLPRLHPRVYLPDESSLCVLKLTIKINQHTQNTWKHWKYANSLTYPWSFCVGEMFAFVFRALRSCIRDTDLRGAVRDLIQSLRMLDKSYPTKLVWFIHLLMFF